MKLDLLCVCERGTTGDAHTHPNGHSLDLVYVREPGTRFTHTCTQMDTA